MQKFICTYTRANRPVRNKETRKAGTFTVPETNIPKKCNARRLCGLAATAHKEESTARNDDNRVPSARLPTAGMAEVSRIWKCEVHKTRTVQSTGGSVDPPSVRRGHRRETIHIESRRQACLLQ